MGVDCRIRLSDKARLRDVADVVGILLGKEATLEPLGNNGTVHCQVEGVSTKPSSAVAECAEIHVDDARWGHDGNRGGRYFFYHFEFSGGSAKGYDIRCGRGMLPRATAINIAMGVELVKFFGGEIDYNDSDAKDINFRAPEQPDIRANDGKAWEKFQRRMFAVKTLTKEQIAKYQKYAAY